MEFELCLFPAKIRPKGFESRYDSAYNLWHQTWSKTLFELDGLQRLYSDGFTRYDYIGAIFSDTNCVSLCCFNHLSLKNPAVLNDSWFAAWDKEMLINISRESENALIPSWLTVHPLYRRTTGNSSIDFGKITTEMLALNILEEGVDIGFGTSRNERSVNKLVYQVGAIPLVQNVTAHNVTVDLVAFYPKYISDKKNSYSVEIKKMWSARKIIFPEYWHRRSKNAVGL